MTIDWSHFTPWMSLAGGVVIGLAAALYLLANGRIAGIAGIVASPLRALLAGTSLRPDANRLLFIAGLLVAPWVWRLAAPLPAATV
ncbi:YeeE/YedE family protein, partial [Roseateles sp. GG27B]